MHIYKTLLNKQQGRQSSRNSIHDNSGLDHRALNVLYSKNYEFVESIQDTENSKGKDPVSKPISTFESYTQTQVLDVSMETLRSRKIFSVDEKSKIGDEFRLLRTRVLQQMRPRGWSTMLVTGFGPEEGKSIVAANLAVSISKDLRQTTTLVDLDFRKPSVHYFFNMEAGITGLKNYFFGSTRLEDIFINPGIDKLTILPAGGKMDNSPELLGSPGMEALVRELKERYSDRIIIFDVPGATNCPDSLIFSEYVDCILLVARACHTNQDAVKDALSVLPREKILGIVLNDVEDM